MALMKQTWSDLVFIHQEVDPDSLRKLIPEPLELDLFEGKAYISFVPFIMNDIKPLGLFTVPYFSSIQEFNLRTYVRYKGYKSVYFVSLDATKTPHIEVARTLFKLNYLKAKIDYKVAKSVICHRIDSRDHKVDFRAEFEASDEVFEPSALTDWLTDRYSYLESKSGSVYAGSLYHEPWQLQNLKLKSIEENYLSSYGIIPVSDEYICNYAAKTLVDIKDFRLTN